MSLSARFALINLILCVALAAQFVLSWHVRGGSDLIYPELRAPLAQVPLEFPSHGDKSSQHAAGGWIGKTNPHEEAIRNQLPFVPDDLLSRTYFRTDSALNLNLYMVYSRQGDDRKHHPEVCIRDVAGAPEDVDARKILFLDADEKHPVQRFRFRTGATQHTTVYYWHFTFPRLPREGETFLQVLHQRGSKPAPSVTVQVSTSAEMDQLEAIERDFLVSLDHVLWERHLPAGTVMGCDRLPIALLRR
jgi:hypothetical protein